MILSGFRNPFRFCKPVNLFYKFQCSQYKLESSHELTLAEEFSQLYYEKLDKQQYVRPLPELTFLIEYAFAILEQ